MLYHVASGSLLIRQVSLFCLTWLLRGDTYGLRTVKIEDTTMGQPSGSIIPMTVMDRGWMFSKLPLKKRTFSCFFFLSTSLQTESRSFLSARKIAFLLLEGQEDESGTALFHVMSFKVKGKPEQLWPQGAKFIPQVFLVNNIVNIIYHTVVMYLNDQQFSYHLLICGSCL